MKKVKTLISIIIAVALVTALTACNSLEVGAPENLKYDGASITWKAVDEADYYLVQINGGEERKVTGASLAYAADGQEFSVKVTAVSEIKKKIGKSGVTERIFKPLDKIETISFQDDGTAYWAAVQNATGYAILLNGKELDAQVTAAQFSAFPVGQNTIQIRPVVKSSSDWYSVWSEAKTITKLGLPANLTYDGENITWSAPNGGAFGYEVYANGIKLNNVTGTSVPYNSQNTNFEVTMKAIGNHSTTYDSAMTESKRFVYLSTVTNFAITDGIISWTAVDGADEYKVKIDNEEKTVKTNSYQGLPAGTDKTISIKPISSDTTYFSNYSTPKVVRLLTAPELVWISGHDAHIGDSINSIQWQEILGASGYRVKVTYQGSEVNLESGGAFSGETRQFAYDFLQSGEYKIYLQAIAPGGGNLYNSVFGNPVTVTRLSAPEQSANNFITSDQVHLNEGFEVNFDRVSGASGYQLYKSGGLLSDYYTAINQFRVVNVLGGENITTEQKFTYSIRSKGSVNGLNVKLDSLPSDDLAFDITVQAMPQNVRMSGYILGWGIISGAEYNVNFGGEITASTSNSKDLKYISPGTYQVNVNSRGNGSNILPSSFSAALTLTRFHAVEDLHVDTEENDGILYYTDYNELGNAYRTFDIFIDGQKLESATVGTFANINNRVTTKNTNVYVEITANTYDSEHPEGLPGAIYYMSSPSSQTLVLARLEQVTFATAGPQRFTNTQFLWNAPSNSDANGAYIPAYEVYKGTPSAGRYHNGYLNGTSLDISGFEGRIDAYDFIVKAVGDGRRYLNSFYIDKDGAAFPTNPTKVSITKLQAPNVGIEDNNFVWGTVSGASKYSVNIDGAKTFDATHLAGGKYTFAPAAHFTSVKNYNVKVYAIGDNGLSTIDSDACQFIQTTKKLTTPEFTFNYSHSSVNVDGKVEFTITNPAKLDNGNTSTKGYIYSIGGATNSSEERLSLTYSRIVSTPGTHSLSVKALGGDFDGTVLGSSSYYIASDTVGGGNHQLKLLGKLNSGSISLNMDKIVQWSSVTNAVKYEYEIVYDEEPFTGSWTETSGASNRSVDISAKSAGHTSVKIRIRAVGNGLDIVSGDYAEMIFYLNT